MCDEAKLKEVFNIFDKDGSGEIDCKELLTCLMQLGKSEEECKAIAGTILAEADTNQDRRITWEEFKTALLK